MIEWLTRVAAWVSQTFNLFVLFGHHDQTLSARAYVNRNRPIWGKVNRAINAVFFWADNHTRASHESDAAFARQVIDADKQQE